MTIIKGSCISTLIVKLIWIIFYPPDPPNLSYLGLEWNNSARFLILNALVSFVLVCYVRINSKFVVKVLSINTLLNFIIMYINNFSHEIAYTLICLTDFYVIFTISIYVMISNRERFGNRLESREVDHGERVAGIQ